MRGLILAIQFLTRLSTLALAEFSPDELARAAIWFPLMGGLGALLTAASVASPTYVPRRSFLARLA